MLKNIIFFIWVLLMVNACHEKHAQPLNPSIEHRYTTQALVSIMHKFRNLIFQQFQSELERDQKRIVYSNEMASLLDELVKSTKELKVYSAQHSLEYIQFANALEGEAKKLRTIIAHYKTEEIAPTLQNINDICTQCHATLQ